MFRTISRAAALIAICGLFTGCASDFVKPDAASAASVKLGQSKPEDVTKLVKGTPIRQQVTIHNEQVDVITYNYVGSPAFWGAVIPHHALSYSFFKDVLVGEELNSTYDGEKTEFDTKKVSLIQKGQTKEQVIAIMGRPAGELLYPLIADKTGSGFAYEYAYARFAPIVSPSWSYLLIVTFNDKGVVSDISYKENGKDVIATNQ